MRSWLPLLTGLSFLFPRPAASQARIETIIPSSSGIDVQRLGAGAPVPAELAMELAPGDLISASGNDVFLELSCESAGQRNTYRITAPFRVLIDVPLGPTCHVNLLAGVTEVIAEAPSQTSVGGVTLGSTGTQYAVEVRPDGAGRAFDCIVYDDTVRVLTRPGVTAAAGTKLVWQSGGRVRLARNTNADLRRAATVHARFDLARAEQRGVRVEDTGTALRQLAALHYDVLADPGDTAKRVALAKDQIRYGATEQATYNLKRVDVTSEARLREYRIDPTVLRDTGAARLRPGDARADITAARMAAPAVPTSASDLALIEAGRVDEAIRNLEARVESGAATSLDEFALAKAYGRKGDSALVRAHAGRALMLHARDDLLGAAELRELGQLIGG